MWSAAIRITDFQNKSYRKLQLHFHVITVPTFGVF